MQQVDKIKHASYITIQINNIYNKLATREQCHYIRHHTIQKSILHYTTNIGKFIVVRVGIIVTN